MNILITGANSGIAFLAGITLSYRGHNVIMTTHTISQLKSLNEKIKRLNLKIKTLKLDITNYEDVKEVMNLEIDVLINNASIGIGGSIIDLPIDKVRENFEVNFFSSYNLAKLFCNNIINQNKTGKLIIISSIAGVVPFEFLGSYCSSKAAITMMARCLKKELKKINSKIQVCLIQPGAYKTGFNQVMVDSFYSNTTNKSYFYSNREKIYNKLNNKFNLIEKKQLKSIVCQIIKAVEEQNNQFVYSAPLLQTILKKVYALIFY